MRTIDAKDNVTKGARNAVSAWRASGPVGSEMDSLQKHLNVLEQAVQESGSAPKLSAAEAAVHKSAKAAAAAWSPTTTAIGSEIDALERDVQLLDEELAAAAAKSDTSAALEDLEGRVATLERKPAAAARTARTAQAKKK